jgi:Zn-dependent membrane protease YugP
VALFAAVAIFALVTLPVEFDATRRAKQQLVSSSIIVGNEMRGVNAVLDAAAMTYVAAAVQAISTLLYYVFLLMGRSEE